MTLGAYCRLSGQLGEILTHGVHQVGMGHGVPLGRVIGVAGIAAHTVVDVRQGVLKGDSVGAYALFVHHVGEVSRFAGEAVSQLVGTAGFRHVGHGVEVAPCAAVVGVERHAFVDSGDHGVVGHIVGHFAVLFRGHVGFIHVRIGFRPACGRDQAHARSGFHHVGRRGRKSAACQAQQKRSHEYGHDDLFHGCLPSLYCATAVL